MIFDDDLIQLFGFFLLHFSSILVKTNLFLLSIRITFECIALIILRTCSFLTTLLSLEKFFFYCLDVSNIWDRTVFVCGFWILRVNVWVSKLSIQLLFQTDLYELILETLKSQNRLWKFEIWKNKPQGHDR